MLVRLCCLAIVAYCTIALAEWCTATMAWLDYMSSGITTCSEGDKLLTWSDWFTPSYTFTIALKCICLQWRISLQCDKLSDGLGSRFLNYNIHRMIDKPLMSIKYTQHKLLCSTQNALINTSIITSMSWTLMIYILRCCALHTHKCLFSSFIDCLLCWTYSPDKASSLPFNLQRGHIHLQFNKDTLLLDLLHRF